MNEDAYNFILKHGSHNLNEAVGLFVDDFGELCENVSGINCAVDGLYAGTVLIQTDVVLIVDYLYVDDPRGY